MYSQAIVTSASEREGREDDLLEVLCPDLREVYPLNKREEVGRAMLVWSGQVKSEAWEAQDVRANFPSMEQDSAQVALWKHHGILSLQLFFLHTL